MAFLKDVFKIKFGNFFKKRLLKKENFVKKDKIVFNSVNMGREVRVELYIPKRHRRIPKEGFSLLLFNDGQDMEAVQLEQALANLYYSKKLRPVLAVGIFPENRMHEYGTAQQLDYAKRGKFAKAYTQFIIEELLPHLQKEYPLSSSKSDYAFAGFSLGGLSALDVVWNQSQLFGKVGVFSGSLWYRSKKFNPKDPDADRMAHAMVRRDGISGKEHVRFWLQAGTKDEKGDRNKNGIIDAIDDTLDLMQSLEEVGFQKEAMKYVEVEDGIHAPSTWKEVLPDFLEWAFGK